MLCKISELVCLLLLGVVEAGWVGWGRIRGLRKR